MRRSVMTARWVAIATVACFGLLAGCAASHDAAGSTQVVRGVPTAKASGVMDEPVHINTIDQSASCRKALRQANPDILLSAFRAARLTSRDAAACLSPRARQAYCDVSHCSRSVLKDSPGPICLHRCFGYVLVDLTVPELTQSPHGTTVATIEAMFRRPSGKTLDETESLTLREHHDRIMIAVATSG